MRFGLAMVMGVSLVGWCLVSSANAQHGGGASARMTGQGGGIKLQGEPELRYIMERLDLDEKQQAHCEALIDEYNTRLADKSEMSGLTSLMLKLQEARKNNDLEQVQKIYEEIKAVQPTTLARNEFLANLRVALTDAQKEKLDEVLKYLENNPTGSVSLLKIFKAALSLQPTSEERRKLDSIHQRFRTEEVAQIRRGTDVPKANLAKKFADELRTAFDESKQAQFDQKISKLLGE